MRIEHLGEFLDLAETLSYVETARRMLVSESTLSRHIKALEEDLGVVLFERTSRRVRLSSQGELLLPYARAMHGSWTAYMQELRSSKLALTIASNYFIGDIIAQFLTAHPDMPVRQVAQGEPNRQLLDMVGRGECQFAVIIGPPPLEDNLDSIVLAHDSYVAALPENHPLAGQAAIDPARLADDHFISFRHGTQGDLNVRSICYAAGFEPNIITSAEVGSSAAQFVRDGLGVTFLLKNTIAKMLTRGVAFVELSPPVAVTAVLCWDKGTPAPAAARAFLDFVREQWA